MSREYIARVEAQVAAAKRAVEETRIACEQSKVAVDLSKELIAHLAKLKKWLAEPATSRNAAKINSS